MLTHDYSSQDDPEDVKVPLAWVFERAGRRVGRTPPKQYGKYRKLVVGVETWFVHCSHSGAKAFLYKALGEGNVDIREIATIAVPDGLKGSWIGAKGCVVGFLKNMLCVDSVKIVGVADWRRR